MKVKKSWLIFLGVLVFALLITVFIPDNFSVKKSYKFKASPYELKSLIGNFKTWKYWAIEKGEILDSIADVEYEGIANTKNHKMTVNVEDKIMTYQIDSISDTYIAYQFYSYKKDKNINSSFTFERYGKDSTLVEWTINGKIGYKPVLRIVNLFIGINKRMTLNMNDAFIRLEKRIANSQDRNNQ